VTDSVSQGEPIDITPRDAVPVRADFRTAALIVAAMAAVVAGAGGYTTLHRPAPVRVTPVTPAPVVAPPVTVPLRPVPAGVPQSYAER
jgi:hypothetical protein